MICINFSENPILAPNCNPTDVINSILEMTDANGIVATVTLSGSLESFTAMNDLYPLRLLGGDGSFEQNGVTVTESYPIGFEFYDAITGALSVVDCKGISSVTPFVDVLSINNTLTVNDAPIFMNLGQTVNIAPTIQANDSDIQGDTQAIISINGHNITDNQPTIINGFIIELTQSGELNFTPNSNTPLGSYTFNYLVQDDNSNPAQDVAQFSINLVQVEPNPNTTNAVDDVTPIEIEELQVLDIAPTLQSNDVDLEGDGQEVTHINGQELILGTPVTIDGVEFVKISATMLTAKPQLGGASVRTFSYSIKDDGSPVATDTANFSLQIFAAPIVLTAGISLDDSNESIAIVTTVGTSYEQGGTNFNIEDDPSAFYKDIYQVEGVTLFSLEGPGNADANSFVFAEFHSLLSQEDINDIQNSFGGKMNSTGYNFNDKVIHGVAVRIGLVTTTLADTGYSREIMRNVTYQSETDLIIASSRTYSYITFETNSTTLEIDTINSGHIIDWGDSTMTNIYNAPSVYNILHTYTSITSGIVWGDILVVDFDDCNLVSLDVTRIPDSLIVIKADNNNLSSLDIANMANLTKVWVGNNNLTSLDYQSLDKIFELSLNGNNFTEVDITQLPLLKRLDISNNQVSVLDVSNNPLFEQLYISGNSISSIDLSNLPNIKQMNLSDNNLTSLAGMNSLNTLNTLVCSNNQINSLEVSSLINLTILHAQNCGLSVIDVENLVLMENMVLESNTINSPINVNGMNVLRYFTCKENGMTSTVVDATTSNLLAANSTAANKTFKVDGNNQPPSNLQTITDLEAQGWTVTHS